MPYTALERAAEREQDLLEDVERLTAERDWLLVAVRSGADRGDEHEAVRRFARWVLTMYEAEHPSEGDAPEDEPTR